MFIPNRFLTGLAATGLSIAMLAASAGAQTLSTSALRAEDMVTTCPKIASQSEYATIYVEFFKFEINEDAGGELDNDLELEFEARVRINEIDPQKPGVAGLRICSGEHGWKEEVPELNIIYGGNYVYPTKRRLIIRNVPRYSVVSVYLDLDERDAGGVYDDDGIDFNPYGGVPGLMLDLFPSDLNGATVVGSMENRRDLQFGKRKRVEGDGEGVGSDYAGAVEFTVTMEVTADERGTGLVSPGASVTPGQAVGNTAAPTPNDHPQCRDYALQSVEQNQQQLALGCGFPPPVWSNDHQMHFDWCVQGNNAQTTPGHLANRRNALDACKVAKGGN